MSASRTRRALVVVLAAVLVVGIALPGLAHTKLYRVTNLTGASQWSIQAITNGLESITGEYCGKSEWLPLSTGYTVLSGVFCSTLTFETSGAPRYGGQRLKIGWTTADGSCRLRDLRWGGGQTVVPEEVGGIPGGGMAFYDWPGPGDLTVVITNDLGDLGDAEPVIDVADVEFAVAGDELTLEELDPLLGIGFVELRVADIDDDIGVLAFEVEYYLATGEVSGPSANSLLRKLGRAADYKHDGLDEHLAGDPDGALVFWAKAAKQVTNFISEVTAAAQKGNLELALYNRWVVHGDGEIVPGPGVRDALLALPEGQALHSLEPLPPGTPLPAYPGLNPAGYVQWPVDELYPGEFTAFVVCGLDLGAGFIMGGSVLDEDDNVVLEWLEQSVADDTPMDTEPPEITASATPDYLWPPNHSVVEMTLNVTVTDNSGFATWYVADVTSNQPESGTGDGDTAPDWGADLQSIWLRAERSGNDPTGRREYTITLIAIDMAGNTSECVLVVPVDHDMG